MEISYFNVDQELLQKFRYIAQCRGRSLGGELDMLVKQSIARYEEEHGKIELSKEDGKT